MKEKIIDENIYTDGSLALNQNEEIYEEKIEIKKKLFYRFIKRLIDIIGGLVGVIILIPMTIAIYIANKLSKQNNGPLFYEQLRIGKNGKIFRIYKYRTMVVGADKILKKYLDDNEEARIEFTEKRKLSNDPRITKLGKFLRKTSIDEFPQFINVLKGDMSIIGPRPLVEGELDEHNGNHEIYESVRPGISGWWAVNGRSDTTYEERIKLEYYYAENFGLWLDIKCIIKTVISVVKKKGAK